MKHGKSISRRAFMNSTFRGLLGIGAVSMVHGCDKTDGEDNNGRMSLAKLEKLLAATPPHTGDNTNRVALYKALDVWARADDTKYWTYKPEESNPEFCDYYLRRMNKALDEAANTRVTSGAVIWKLYSSGVLIKTPDGVFAIDVVEGPFAAASTKMPETQPGYTFYWTEQMRAKFASLVDVLFVTHGHFDHVCYSLIIQMAQAGKTVIVPEQIKKQWYETKPFADRIKVVQPDTDQAVAGFTFRTFDGVQYMSTDENGKFISTKSDAQNNVYLIRDSRGTTFLHNGDNRGASWEDWFDKALADGWKPDIWFWIPHDSPQIYTQLEKKADFIYIPVHEYELAHKPDSNIHYLMDYYEMMGRQRFLNNRCVLMSWGERFSFNR